MIEKLIGMNRGSRNRELRFVLCPAVSLLTFATGLVRTGGMPFAMTRAIGPCRNAEAPTLWRGRSRSEAGAGISTREKMKCDVVCYSESFYYLCATKLKRSELWQI